MITKKFFDPLNNYYKSKIGAVENGKKVRFRVKGEFDSVFFVYAKDGEREIYVLMDKKASCFELFCEFDVGLYTYYFIADGKKFYDDRIYQLTVYDKNFKTPDWIKGGIIYQIFPDRFYQSPNYEYKSDRKIHQNKSDVPEFKPDKYGEVKNDDFFGGNLKGITEKLPYLKSLSVSAIYLNPIFKAYSNHRYDTGDYFTIDPMLGTEDDLINLIENAKALGIGIILDGVFNHVGADSLYFNKYGNYNSCGAYQSKDSPYYSWFDFIDYPNDYRSWWGIKTLPSVNKDNKEFIRLICGEKGVIDKYTKLGVKGFRLDVVDELPSEFVKNIRSALKSSDKNAVLIGEVWEDASNKISYGKRREYLLGKELDSVMNYPLKNSIIEYVLSGDCSYLSQTIREQIDHYPKKVLDCLMNILSTHDTSRLLSILSGKNKADFTKEEDALFSLDENDKKNAVFNLKCAVLLQYTLYGVPSVYYGDEAGLEGFYDPINRKYFPWDNINNELYSWYVKLGKLRTSVSVFKSGKFKELFAHKGVYVFKRCDISSSVVVAVNLSESETEFKFNGQIYEFFSEQFYKSKFILSKKNFAVFLKTPLKVLTSN